MMRREGYRKTIRLMELADKFKIPIISFIDTLVRILELALKKEGKLRQ